MTLLGHCGAAALSTVASQQEDSEYHTCWLRLIGNFKLPPAVNVSTDGCLPFLVCRLCDGLATCWMRPQPVLDGTGFCPLVT